MFTKVNGKDILRGISGNSPTVIMKASGHKTMSMFIRYDLVDEEDLKRMKWVDSESESNNEDFGAKISA